jgi:hypothetical protein
MPEVITAMKKNPGARFKLCADSAEAERLLTWIPENGRGLEGSPFGSKRYPGESSPAPEASFGHPSLGYGRLSELRMVIESGRTDEFKQMVWSNPKFLIGNGDSPTLLREGKWR